MFSSDLVYDVGMHLGEDTAFYLALGYRVVAFEANPELVSHCRSRFSKELNDGRLTIVSGAIAANDGRDTITFFKNPSKSVWGTTSEEWVNRNAKLLRASIPVTVETVDFAKCLENYGTPLYVKIDVEGVDGLVVSTICSATILPKYLSMESEKVDFDKLVEDINALARAGYSRFKVVQQANWPGHMMELKDRNGNKLPYRFEPHASGPFGDDIPQAWCTAGEAIQQYRDVFRMYRAIGDGTVVGRWGRIVTKPIERLFRVPLPGWHDLHAMRDG